MRKFTLLLVVIFTAISVFIVSIYGIPYGSYDPTITVESVEFTSNEEVKIETGIVDGKKIKTIRVTKAIPCEMALTYRINPTNATNQTVYFTTTNHEIATVNPGGIVSIYLAYQFSVRISSGQDSTIFDEVIFVIKK